MNNLGFEQKNITFCPRLAPLRIHELKTILEYPCQWTHHTLNWPPAMISASVQ